MDREQRIQRDIKRRQAAGAWLETKRKEVGLLQAHVASALGVKPTYVSAIERGSIWLPTERYFPCALALGVDPQEFAQHMTSIVDPDLFALLFPPPRGPKRPFC